MIGDNIGVMEDIYISPLDNVRRIVSMEGPDLLNIFNRNSLTEYI